MKRAAGDLFWGFGSAIVDLATENQKVGTTIDFDAVVRAINSERQTMVGLTCNRLTDVTESRDFLAFQQWQSKRISPAISERLKSDARQSPAFGNR